MARCMLQNLEQPGFAEVFKKRGLVAACIATGTASFWAKHIVPDQFHVAIKRVYHFFKDKR